MGGSEVPFRYQEFSGVSRVLPEIHSRLLQDCSTPHSSDEERGGFSVGPRATEGVCDLSIVFV